VVGIVGYRKYGEDVTGSITLSLPLEPWSTISWFNVIVKVAISLSVLLTYGVQFLVPLEIMLPLVHSRISTHWCAEPVLRFLMVTLTFIMAYKGPSLDLYLPLVGSVTSSLLTLVVPAVTDTVTFWGRRSKLWDALNLVITFVGLLGLFVGAYGSISNIIN